MSADLEPLRAALQPVFASELDDALVSIRAVIARLERGEAVENVRDVVVDSLRGIRGAAAPLGFAELAGYLTRVADRVEARGHRVPDSAAVLSALESVADTMSEWSRSLREARPFDYASDSNDESASDAPEASRVEPAPESDSPSDAVTLAGDAAARLLRHLMQLEMARTRLSHRLGAEGFDPDLAELESHGRSLRDLLSHVSPKPSNAFAEAQIVRVAGERFALPLASIIEGHRASRVRVLPIAGGRSLLELQGQQLPVVELSHHVDRLEATGGEFLLVIDAPDEAGDGGSAPVALRVDAVEDPEIVCGPETANERAGVVTDVVAGVVELASGERARLLDVRALCRAGALRAARKPPTDATARPSVQRPSQPRPTATNTWRSLARRTTYSNEGGLHGRDQ